MLDRFNPFFFLVLLLTVVVISNMAKHERQRTSPYYQYPTQQENAL